MLPRTLLVIALSCALAAPAFAQTGTLEKIRRDGAISLGYIENAATHMINQHPLGLRPS